MKKILTLLIITSFSLTPILAQNNSTKKADKLFDRLEYVKAAQEYLKLAGIESKNFAGHSLRSGFATVAADSGADERSIMAMTGHKTTQMVRRYIREANIFKNNALNKIKI